eukprot:Phypoly_transcript_03943.p1 GENE.Phypoly_transcript_03943~~Phypoly_transcript_03943.p1  ORF type:complete len:571 (-),score=108.22 Phypoly_transcript_03943:510-2222(-)
MRCALLGLPRPTSSFFPLHSFSFLHKREMTEALKHKEAQPSNKKQKMENLPTPKYSDKITLTEEEKHIFDTLLDVVKTSGCGSVLRVAGGWVRDKLLGDASHDLDIALDNMMGQEFTTKINEYFVNHKQEPHKVGVIKSNPDQSKHLETATMHIFGRWMDFVNLRAETYSEDSRIPETMKIGTVYEDATRRDLTINSMFYNINDGRVEDFTGKGLSDLELGIIRTPLPAFATFIDDPLRVLRSVRFASRFNFAVDSELFEASSNKLVKDALRDKISRERIGKEIEGMLTSACPEVAFQYIDEMDIHDEVFKLPPNYKMDDPDYRKNCVLNVRQISRYLRYQQKHYKTSGLYVDPKDKRIAMLSGLMEPYYKHTFENRKRKDMRCPLPYFIIAESLKLSNKDVDDVNTILKGAQQLVPHVHKDESQLDRKTIGLILRQIANYWQTALLLAFVREIEPFKEPLAHPIHHSTNKENPTKQTRDPEVELPESAKPLLAKYDAFVNWVQKVGLVGVWDMKTILNGGEVQALLNAKPGPWMGPTMQRILEWQLEHPESNKKECEKWVLENSKDLIK